MSEPSIGAVGTQNPTFVSESIISSEPPPAESQTCVDPSSGGAEGAGGQGAEALVRRFSAPTGTGGTGGYEPELPAEASCDNKALAAFGACGATAVLAVETRGLAVLFEGAQCLSKINDYIDCVAKK